MTEIQLTRIKSLYGEIKGYFISLPKQSSGPYIVPVEIGRNYNIAVSELTQISGINYDRFKVPNIEERRGSDLNIRLVQPQMSALVSRLEEEFGFGKNDSVPHPTIAIFNKNQNNNTIEINYTINDLIAEEKSDTGKDKLNELKQELRNPNKNWEKIKSILIWILNYSKELSLKIIPIILQSKL